MASEKSPLFEWHFSDLNHSNFHIDSRGLLLVLFFFSLIFIITTLSFYARWACIRGRLSTTTSRATNIASLPQVHQSLGLDAAAIDNLPVVLHRSVQYMSAQGPTGLGKYLMHLPTGEVIFGGETMRFWDLRAS
ncbi:uncharacterized protein LOC126588742 [Malus sylvestris]|uniref:uncharacterized protein LOC126588742 n=1 Tax=Malus sylvestris TaxID=3752 RepID=UPI0021ABB30B|nr:uncharacterized protein LOC126588742 [Malus sylvestris]